MGNKPAYFFDVTSLTWLPTLHLGHERTDDDDKTSACVGRYKRAKERGNKRTFLDEILEQAPVVVTQQLELKSTKEIRVIVTEQIKIVSENIKLNSSAITME